jgi:ribosome-binding protein aMBF1 (putative translation factor)
MARPKPGQPPPRPAGPTPDPGPAGKPPKRNPPTEAERAFGERLRKAREEIGLKLHEAAETLRIKPQRLIEYETGRRLPPVLRLVEIVQALGLDPSTLLPELFEGWERKRRPKKNQGKPVE